MIKNEDSRVFEPQRNIDTEKDSWEVWKLGSGEAGKLGELFEPQRHGDTEV